MDLASSFRVGAKVVSGVPKRLFSIGFGYNVRKIFDALLEDLGYKLTRSFLAMPSESSEVGRLDSDPAVAWVGGQVWGEGPCTCFAKVLCCPSWFIHLIVTF